MKRPVALAIAAISVAGTSVAVAVVNPLAIASAQTTPSTTTAPPSGTTPVGPGRLAKALSDKVLGPLVADGTITQAQADKIEAKATELAGTEAGALREKAKSRIEGLKCKLGAEADEIASYLGITVDQLKADLHAGKSLGDIAGDKKQGLTDLLVGKANTRIDAAVTASKLTADKAATLKAKVPAAVAAAVDHKGLGGGGLGRRSR
jgi:hypothetical protein